MNRKKYILSILKTLFYSFLAPFSSLFLFKDTLSVDEVSFFKIN